MGVTKKEESDKIFNDYFTLAKNYYEEHNNLLIPQNYIINNKRLGRWIGLQREYYKSHSNPFFDDTRIKKLESIHMIWDVKNSRWDIMFNELIKYKEKYNNTRVPESYITDNNLKLGIWINRQRIEYHLNKLDKDKITKLNNIDMIWNAKKLVTEKWDINFNLLKDYLKDNNKFPTSNYITSDGIKLGSWVSRQRLLKNKLSKSKIDKLNSINFNWNILENQWNFFYNKAVLYYKKYNDLCVYYAERKADEKLRSWLSKQRRLYNQKKLNKFKIKKLNDIHMIWDIKEYELNKMYNEAQLFYQKNKHLKVSKSIEGPNKKLGIWLEEQRRNYRKDNHYNDELIKKLESINMIWNPYKSPILIWEEWFIKAKDFYNKNNHLIPKEGKLRTWVLAQRAAYKNLRGHLTKIQIKRLENISMVWEPLNKNWMKKYLLAVDYYAIHKMLNIPTTYVVNDINLGIWISRQRNIYKQKIKSNNLTNTDKERIRLLNNIDMIWDASTISAKTSFQEKTIFYYVKQYFKDTIKVTKWEYFGYELDVFIPSISTAIEYDGLFHKNSLFNDVNKDKACLDNNIKIIRIREPNLPIIKDNSIIINIKDESFKSLENALKKIFKLLNIEEIKFNIKKDQTKILETYKDYSSQKWDSYYNEAYMYFKKNNTINTITTDKYVNNTLKSWIYEQRDLYKQKKLTSLQIKKLESLNFMFDFYKDIWNKHYELAKNYYKEKGNLLIPHNYEVSNVKLGYFISKQRGLYKKNKLSVTKINELNKIGMIWDVKKQAKDIYIKALKNYFKKFNNINIPSSYINNGIKLGSWIEDQRYNYRHNKIDQTIKKELDKYNFKINVFEERWNEMYEVAKNYYNSHGTLWLSPKYITENKIHLGGWISYQRQKFLNKSSYTKLELKQIDLLNQIGMVWNPYNEKWMKNYNLAKEYFKKYGNLNIPIDYTINGVNLGSWISTQRQANRGNPNYCMTKERKKLLEEIHMNFNLKNPRKNARKRDNFL